MELEYKKVHQKDEKEEFTEEDPLRENFEQELKKPIKTTCSSVFRNVTVEPTMFLFVLCLVLCVLTSQNLNLEKACRVNLNFTHEICDALKFQTVEGQNQYERDVQHLVTEALAWKTYITATIPCILALFLGSWSDRTGYRKLFLVIALFGQILVCFNGIINTIFIHKLPLEVFVFSEAILDGLSGSWCVSFLTMFAYISAVTTKENRTFRMGLLNFSLTVGFPVGMGISGILLRKFGYYGCYGLAGGLHILNLIYNATVLKDPERTADQKKVSNSPTIKDILHAII